MFTCYFCLQIVSIFDCGSFYSGINCCMLTRLVQQSCLFLLVISSAIEVLAGQKLVCDILIRETELIILASCRTRAAIFRLSIRQQYTSFLSVISWSAALSISIGQRMIYLRPLEDYIVCCERCLLVGCDCTCM